MLEPLALTSQAQRNRTRSELLESAERMIAHAAELVSEASIGRHWTEQFRLSGLKVKIESTARAVQTEIEEGEEGCLTVTCKRCSVEFADADEAECCEDGDCPMQFRSDLR